MSATQIKRLFQNKQEFVPITLSEAVVVNTTNIPELSGLGITTLDKVLRHSLNKVGANSQAISQFSDSLNQAVSQINEELANKQDKLTAGYGITIEPDDSGNLVISTNVSFEIYKIAESLPLPSASQTNTIYLVPTNNTEANDVLEEYLCIQKDGEYVWERLGRIQPETGIDLSNYVTRDEFNAEINNIKSILVDSITAVDVTVSESAGGQAVIVSYTIPEDLYDSLVATGDDDQIITP